MKTPGSSVWVIWAGTEWPLRTMAFEIVKHGLQWHGSGTEGCIVYVPPIDEKPAFLPLPFGYIYAHQTIPYTLFAIK